MSGSFTIKSPQASKTPNNPQVIQRLEESDSPKPIEKSPTAFNNNFSGVRNSVASFFKVINEGAIRVFAGAQMRAPLSPNDGKSGMATDAALAVPSEKKETNQNVASDSANNVGKHDKKITRTEEEAFAIFVDLINGDLPLRKETSLQKVVDDAVNVLNKFNPNTIQQYFDQHHSKPFHCLVRRDVSTNQFVANTPFTGWEPGIRQDGAPLQKTKVNELIALFEPKNQKITSANDIGSAKKDPIQPAKLSKERIDMLEARIKVPTAR